MIKLILVILFTSLAVILGPLLADSQGFVHIATNSKIIETSITTAIVIYILSVFIIFAVYAILRTVFRSLFNSETKKNKSQSFSLNTG